MSLPPEELAYQEAHINDDRSTGLTVAYVVALVVSTIAVALRIVARRISKTALKADDFTVILALCTYYALIGTSIYQTYAAGTGKHVVALQPEQLILWGKFDIVWSVLYTPTIILCKTSILLLYLRIFVTPTFTLLCKLCLVFILGLFIVSWTVIWALCRPLSRFWDSTIPGTCIDTYRYYLTGTALNVLIDVAILTLPMPVIWSLKMPRRQQLWVSGIFGLGFICTITTILRAVAFVHLDTNDITYSWVDSAYWTNVAELATAFLCACLPAMGPLLRNLHPMSHTRGSPVKGGGNMSWDGSTNNNNNTTHQTSSSAGGRWYSLSRKEDRQSELDTIDQAENGIFVPPGTSGLEHNKISAWSHDESRGSESDNVPLQPKAIYVQNEVNINRSKV